MHHTYRNDYFDNSMVYKLDKNKYISEFDIIETLLTIIFEFCQANNTYQMQSIPFSRLTDAITQYRRICVSFI